MTTIRTKDVQLKTLKVGDEFTVKPGHSKFKVMNYKVDGWPSDKIGVIHLESGYMQMFRDTTPVQLIKTIK